MAKTRHRITAASRMSKTLAPLFNDLPPDEFSTKSCPAKASCTLAAGIEHLFAHQTAQKFLEVAKAPFCQYVYMPHSTSEKGGFDLSLGHFAGNHRVLLMHKLVRHVWCDGEWMWCSSKDAKAHGQIDNLLGNYLKGCGYLPFLALHVCYCVHEYRRMGSDMAGIQVPDFSHATRSAFVNLVPILKVNKWQDRFAANELEVQLDHPKDAPAVEAAVYCRDDKQKVRVLEALDLSTFLAHAEKHLGI